MWLNLQKKFFDPFATFAIPQACVIIKFWGDTDNRHKIWEALAPSAPVLPPPRYVIVRACMSPRFLVDLVHEARGLSALNQLETSGSCSN